MDLKFHKDPVTFKTIICGFGSYLEKGNKKLLNLLKDTFIKY